MANLESLPERATQRIEELRGVIEEADEVIEANQTEYDQKWPDVQRRTASLAEQKRKVEEEISEHRPEEDRVSQEVSASVSQPTFH